MMKMSVPVTIDALDVKALKSWLTENHASIEVPTNEWEVLRYQTNEGDRTETHIIYRNKKSQLTWTGKSAEHYAKFSGRNAVTDESLDQKTRRPFLHPLKKADLIAKIIKRDGHVCWFCTEFLHDDRTLEHLVPTSRGGKHSLANCVLTHAHCNKALADNSVAEKTHLRDSVRAALSGTPPWQTIKPKIPNLVKAAA